jgi:hypothetical protein
MIKSSCAKNILSAQCKRVNPMPMTLKQEPYAQGVIKRGTAIFTSTIEV